MTRWYTPSACPSLALSSAAAIWWTKGRPARFVAEGHRLLLVALIQRRLGSHATVVGLCERCSPTRERYRARRAAGADQALQHGCLAGRRRDQVRAGARNSLPVQGYLRSAGGAAEWL